MRLPANCIAHVNEEVLPFFPQDQDPWSGSALTITL